jgi:chromosome segregation ATPase
MTEWVSNFIAALVSGGGVTAVAYAYVRVIRARHEVRAQTQAAEIQAKVQARSAEIQVLYDHIAELRKDRDAQKADGEALRQELNDLHAAKDREMNDLRSEHTACLITTERLEVELRHEVERCTQLAGRVSELERQLGA